MTDTTNTPADSTADEPTGPAAPDDTADASTSSSRDDDGQDDGRSAEGTPNSEAARYRVRLRETEAERDKLTERLAGYQRLECETAVADLLDLPADLFDVGGADVAAFYGDDGELRADELRAAAGALVEQRPRLAKPSPPARDWGQAGSAPPPTGPTWSDIVNRR